MGLKVAVEGTRNVFEATVAETLSALGEAI
jgi:hypothetical protein